MTLNYYIIVTEIILNNCSDIITFMIMS